MPKFRLFPILTNVKLIELKNFLFGLILFHALTAEAFGWGLKDLGEEISVPLTTDAKDVVIYGTATTLILLAFQDQIVDPVQEEAVRAKPLGTSSQFGNLIGLGYPNLIYIFGQAIGGATGDDKGYDRSIGMFKATLYASSVTQILKVTVREQRPGNKNERDSFPSGHSTIAFAFGGYILEEHGWQWGVPALLMSIFTGASRINDNRHYLHDVVAGATIGLAYGVGMSKFQIKKEKVSFMLVPIIDAQTKGLVMIEEF